MTPREAPLTDEEIDEVDRFLLETEGLDEAMEVAMLDGYLAALMSGPNTILPSQWMAWMWDTKKARVARCSRAPGKRSVSWTS